MLRRAARLFSQCGLRIGRDCFCGRDCFRLGRLPFREQIHIGCCRHDKIVGRLRGFTSWQAGRLGQRFRHRRPRWLNRSVSIKRSVERNGISITGEWPPCSASRRTAAGCQYCYYQDQPHLLSHCTNHRSVNKRSLRISLGLAFNSNPSNPGKPICSQSWNQPQ